MYPLKAILIGCSNPIEAELRRELANLGAPVEAVFPTIAAVLGQPLPQPEEKRLLIIQLKGGPDTRQMEGLNEALTGWPILALVAADADTATLYEAMRAGAAQLVPLPGQPADFKRALDRIARQFGYSANVSQLVVVTGATEGCGATTLAINLAYEMAEFLHVPCILTELALQMGRLALYLDMEPHRTLPQLLGDPERLTGLHARQALTKVTDNLYVLPGPHRTIESVAAVPAVVVQALRLLKQLTSVLIVDMPGPFDDLYFQVLGQADRIVLVAEQKVPSIQSLQLLRGSLEQKQVGARQHGIVNRYDPHRKEFSLEHLEELLQMPQGLVAISREPALGEAVNNGRPLRQEAPRSPALREIRQLAQAVMAAKPPPVKPRPGFFRRLFGRN